MQNLKQIIKDNYSKILPILFGAGMWLYGQFTLIKKNADRIEYINKKYEIKVQDLKEEEKNRNKDVEKKFDVLFAMINKNSGDANYTKGRLDGYIAGQSSQNGKK